MPHGEVRGAKILPHFLEFEFIVSREGMHAMEVKYMRADTMWVGEETQHIVDGKLTHASAIKASRYCGIRHSAFVALYIVCCKLRAHIRIHSPECILHSFLLIAIAY